MYVLGSIAILGVLVGLHNIVTYQAEIAFEEFDSKQRTSDTIALQPDPRPVFENKTVVEKEK
mgnify:CR=1 FL=1